jgi:hypothetical protein
MNKLCAIVGTKRIERDASTLFWVIIAKQLCKDVIGIGNATIRLHKGDTIGSMCNQSMEHARTMRLV